ncbi:MAG: glycosyltransferase family 4 protein [Desulfarculaceae bacterium]|jgi:glycosyltransferase involved in cell wall biosynthesis
MNNAFTKPQVLIMPNVAHWIEGKMALEAISLFSHLYDFYFLTEGIATRRADIFRALLRRVDFIQAMDESAASLVVRAAPGKHPPMMTWLHHVTTWSPEQQVAVDNSEIILACTPEWARTIQEMGGRRDRLFYVVRHGVDSVKFQKVPSPDRRKFGIPDGAFVLGFMASKGSDRDARRKGVDTFLEVVRLSAGRIGNLHVSFTSGGWGEEVESLRQAGVSANDAGYLPSKLLPHFYSCLDAFLMTARVEGGPCTVLEAMACRTPVVATSVGLVPETIEHGVNGFKAPPDDAPALAESVALLSSSPELADRIGAQARKTAEKLPWSQTFQALAEPYRKMASLGAQGRDAAKKRLCDPPRFLKKIQAADAMGLAWSQYQSGGVSLLQALGRMRDMAEGVSLQDCVRALPLLIRPHWL